MPKRPPKRCRAPGCNNMTHDTYCEEHSHLAPQRQADERRLSSTARGYDRRWRKARARYLQEHPLCEECDHAGRVVPATVVDHIVPHRGDQKLFWDENNWQGLCKRCHDKKTQRELAEYPIKQSGYNYKKMLEEKRKVQPRVF